GIVREVFRQTVESIRLRLRHDDERHPHVSASASVETGTGAVGQQECHGLGRGSPQEAEQFPLFGSTDEAPAVAACRSETTREQFWRPAKYATDVNSEWKAVTGRRLPVAVWIPVAVRVQLAVWVQVAVWVPAVGRPHPPGR